jgi:predicted nucleic acid-binding protein
MALTVRAQVVDIRADKPQSTDVFLVDTNAWYWLFYPRATQTPNGPQAHQLTDYPGYLKAAMSARSALNCYALSFSELAHNIEKSEREIYEVQAGKVIRSKDFRHDYAGQRRKVVSLINDTWADVLSVGSLLDLTLDASFMKSALSLFPSAGLDGYDLFMAEAALQANITQVVTDDGDYATVPGLTVFTANQRVIQEAANTGRLVQR